MKNVREIINELSFISILTPCCPPFHFSFLINFSAWPMKKTAPRMWLPDLHDYNLKFLISLAWPSHHCNMCLWGLIRNKVYLMYQISKLRSKIKFLYLSIFILPRFGAWLIFMKVVKSYWKLNFSLYKDFDWRGLECCDVRWNSSLWWSKGKVFWIHFFVIAVISSFFRALDS